MAYVATAIGLIGTAASVAGNEAAIRLGRRKLIALAMVASIALGVSLGVFGQMSYTVAVVLLLFYALAIWLDSSSLTAGAAGTAEPSKRGATLAVHSMLGYAGGFVGPLIVGWILDYYGGSSNVGWAAAFGCIAAFTLAGIALFSFMKPRELIGDRAAVILHKREPDLSN